MDLIFAVIIGVALSMDCFAVSLAIGTATRTSQVKAALVIACCFGFFQTLMTLLGWAAGAGFAGLVGGFDHWLACILLAAIGFRMILEGLKGEEEDEGEMLGAIRFMPVMALSIATSIDALAVGVSFALLQMEVVVSAVIIGIVAFIISFAGVMSGMRLKSVLGKRIVVAGGLILIAIGLNVLFTHLAAG